MVNKSAGTILKENMSDGPHLTTTTTELFTVHSNNIIVVDGTILKKHHG